MYIEMYKKQNYIYNNITAIQILKCVFLFIYQHKEQKKNV